jgi:hypothetical protein
MSLIAQPRRVVHYCRNLGQLRNETVSSLAHGWQTAGPAGDRCSCATSAGLHAHGATEVQGSGSRNLAYLPARHAIVLIKKLRPIRGGHQRRGVAERHLVSWRTLPAEGPEQSRVRVTAALTLMPGPELSGAPWPGRGRPSPGGPGCRSCLRAGDPLTSAATGTRSWRVFAGRDTPGRSPSPCARATIARRLGISRNTVRLPSG